MEKNATKGATENMKIRKRLYLFGILFKNYDIIISSTIILMGNVISEIGFLFVRKQIDEKSLKYLYFEVPCHSLRTTSGSFVKMYTIHFPYAPSLVGMIIRFFY